MRMLLRSLALAGVLAASLSTPNTTEAAYCPAGGICSETCRRCYSDADCPSIDGYIQTCRCGYLCP